MHVPKGDQANLKSILTKLIYHCAEMQKLE